MVKKKESLKKYLPSLQAMIGGIVVITFALLVFLGLLDQGGPVATYLSGYSQKFFGFGAYIVPFLLFGGAIFIFRMDKYPWVKTIGILFFSLASLGLLQLIFNWSRGGGVIGAWEVRILRRYFDFWGTLLVLGSFFLISFLGTFSFPHYLLATWRKRKITQKAQEEGEKQEEEEEGKEEEGTILTRKPIIPLGRDKKEKQEKKSKQKKKEEKKTDSKATKDSEDGYIPSLDILKEAENKKRAISRGEIRNSKATIKDTFNNFDIEVEMGDVSVGPTVTQYTFEPERGVKLSKIESLQKDLSMALAAHPLRIEAPIPGRSVVGVEVPNEDQQEVRLKQLLTKKEFKNRNSDLTVPLGLDVAGEPTYDSLDSMPHLLIAGATGSGKSVCIHNIITSFLYQNSPQTLRLILADPKRVELTIYDGIPHLLTPVISKPQKVINALKWATSEMERRYDFLSESKARNLRSLNEKLQNSEPMRSYAKEEGLLQSGDTVPYIVIIIDELADIMSQFGNEMEAVVVRLAQMARAVGIHLVLSTQRPSVEVITGLIKANITTRIAFQVASQVDSRTILDQGGAEKLLGNGDMLYLPGDSQEPQRVQGVFVSEGEVSKIVKYLKKQPSVENLKGGGESAKTSRGRSSVSEKIRGYKEKESEDELYPDAKEIVIDAGKGSASLLQRKLRIGYARAARLLDMMEEEGIVGPARGSKARKVKVNKDQVDFD